MKLLGGNICTSLHAQDGCSELRPLIITLLIRSQPWFRLQIKVIHDDTELHYVITILHNGGGLDSAKIEKWSDFFPFLVLGNLYKPTWENLFKRMRFFFCGLFSLLAPLGHHCCTQEYRQAEATLHFCPWVSHDGCFSCWGA